MSKETLSPHIFKISESQTSVNDIVAIIRERVNKTGKEFFCPRELAKKEQKQIDGQLFRQYGITTIFCDHTQGTFIIARYLNQKEKQEYQQERIANNNYRRYRE